MGLSKKMIGKLGQIYTTIALVILNTFVLFVIINLLADGALDLMENAKKKEGLADQGMRSMFRKYEPPLAAVYPNMQEQEVTRLIRETSALSFIYEPYTVFKQKPFSGKYVTADSRGFRPIGNQGPWPPSKKDIVVYFFGGSTAFGWGVPDNQSIPSYFQEYLRKRISDKVCVYNFARCSYISVQERILLENLILKDHVPDVAVFLDGFNDSTREDGLPSFTKELTRYMAEGHDVSAKSIVREFPIIRLVNTLKGKSPEKKKKNDQAEKVAQDPQEIAQAMLRQYLSNKKLIEAVGDTYGIKLLFVWQPVPCYNYDINYSIFAKFNYSHLTPFTKSSYEYAKQAYEDKRFGDHFLWLADMQASLKKPLYSDAYHYSAEMNALMAEHIVNHIEKTGLLKTALDKE